MKVKALILGLAYLCFLFTIGTQGLEKYTLSELASVMDSAVFEATGSRVKTVLKRENGLVSFYIDTQVKDFTSSAGYVDYKTINAIVVCAAITMKKVSWKADRVWFLRAGEKVAWISVGYCEDILAKSSKSPSYLFKGIQPIDIDPTVLHQVAYWSGSENDSRNTETFVITTDAWRIWWDTEPGVNGKANFQIYINKPNEDLVDVAANVIGKSNQWTTIRQKGKFYLKIITGQPYMITIYEEREQTKK